MPLSSGRGKKAHGKNVAELVRNFKAKGTIGHSKPPSMEAALKQANAIAYRKSREGKK